MAEIAAEQEKAKIDMERARIGQTQAEAELLRLRQFVETSREEMKLLDEEANLRSFGFYKPQYSFDSSSKYQLALDRIRDEQKSMISGKTAATCSIEWTVNGSRTEGRKQINQSLKLILRAFNGECDAAIAKVKYNNVAVMEARIRKSWETVNKLVQVQQCAISVTYLNLKLQELFMVHEYQEKLQAEKEEQRQIREQMREEEIARRELERAIQEAERDEARYAEALRKARAEADKAVGEKQERLYRQLEEMQTKLAEAQAKRERAVSQAQLTRSGHVYIISNIGSFGEDIYKIGMTRRLDPLDRIRELGDASVPFQFDVHAIIWSEDAPFLETALHQKFNHRRVNQINQRKEFFHVSIEEIAQEVHRSRGQIEITRVAEAAEYRKTLAKQKEANRLHILNSSLPNLVVSSTPVPPLSL